MMTRRASGGAHGPSRCRCWGQRTRGSPDRPEVSRLVWGHLRDEGKIVVSRRTRWLIAAAAAAGALGAVASSIDQGSLSRTMRPLRRPERGRGGYAGDIAFLRRAVGRHELGITREQHENFGAVLGRHRVNTIDDLVLTCQEALAVFDNAATTVLHTQAHRLPVRFGWFRDSLVVVKAAPDHAHLAGQRVRLIGGSDPAVAWPLFERFVGGGTPSWLRNRSAWFFTVPEAMRRIGLGVHDGSVRLEPVSYTHLTLPTTPYV